jgi:hypothetical protein
MVMSSQEPAKRLMSRLDGAGDPVNAPDRCHHQRSKHGQARDPASRHHEDAGDQHQRKGQFESLEQEEPGGLQRRDHEQHHDDQQGQRGQKPVAPLFPKKSDAIVHQMQSYFTIESRRE